MARDRERTIPILYQDDDLLVVDKPSGILVVHAPDRKDPTVVDLVSKQVGHRVFAVHRLDEDVTGVLALAAHPDARKPLDAVFRRHQARRLYLARVARMPDPVAGRIESRLQVGPDGMVRSVVGGRGEAAVTDYEVVERHRHGALVLVRLETGRRNQIRVHLAELGCPIVGDRKYGFRAAKGGPDARRPLLHAWRLGFFHPLTGGRIEVEAPPRHPELVPRGEVESPLCD